MFQSWDRVPLLEWSIWLSPNICDASHSGHKPLLWCCACTEQSYSSLLTYSHRLSKQQMGSDALFGDILLKLGHAHHCSIWIHCHCNFHKSRRALTTDKNNVWRPRCFCLHDLVSQREDVWCPFSVIIVVVFSIKSICKNWMCCGAGVIFKLH